MVTPEWPMWIIPLGIALGIGWLIARRYSRVLGMLFAAAVIFIFIHSSTYPFDGIGTGIWFTAIVLLGFLLVLFSLVIPERSTFTLRRFGMSIAALALAIAVVHSFWALPGMVFESATGLGHLKQNIAVQMDATNKRVDALVAAQSAKEEEQDDRLTKLEERMTSLEGRANKLEDRVTKTEATVGGITSTKTDVNPDVKQSVIDKMAEDLYNAGWRKGDVKIGTVDWNNRVEDRGDASFIDYTLTSQEKVRQYIMGPGANAQAAREYLQSNVPDREKARVVSNSATFIPVQFTQGVCLKGNTYFDGKHAVNMEKERCHPENYVIWVYVGEDGTLYWDASIACDCGNPGNKSVPAPANKAKSAPTAEPSEEPTTEPSEEPTTEPSEEPTTEPTCTWSDGTSHPLNSNGTCPKEPAAQPSGVESPVSNPVASAAESSPAAKETPLTPTQGTDDIDSDGHTATETLVDEGGDGVVDDG